MSQTTLSSPTPEQAPLSTQDSALSTPEPQARAEAALPRSTGSGPTGPRTPEGKARTRLNAFRHGLTGQTFVLDEGDAKRYRNHHADVVKYYQPVGPIEAALTEQIAAGIWRLQRCAAIEEGAFAMDAVPQNDCNTLLPTPGYVGPAQTWMQQGKAINLLSLYEGRIRRALDKDEAKLEALQSRRKEEAAQAMNQAVALHGLAKKQGKPYQPERYFTTPPPTPESVFSTDIVAAEFARREAWAAAQAALKTAA